MSVFETIVTSSSELLLSSRKLPHQEHTAALPTLALRPSGVPNRRLGARESASPRARPVVGLHRDRTQLPSGADPTASELPQQRRIGAAADASELTGEGSGTGQLGCYVAEGTPAPSVRGGNGSGASG